MLNRLRPIVQQVSAATTLAEALRIIVTKVKAALAVDVCSVYLADYENEQLVLHATDGLNQMMEGRLRLDFAEGLVGFVAQREEPINLEQAADHPRFRYFSEAGEDAFNAFLGVPIVHQGKVLGVLVIQQQRSRRFEDDEEAFLITLSAQLAGVIAHAESSGVFKTDTRAHSLRFKGLPGATGIGIGKAVVFYPPADLDGVPDRPASNCDDEIHQFRVALGAAQDQIKSLGERLSSVLGRQELALFDAYQAILSADSLGVEVEAVIRQGVWAQGALRQVITRHVEVFQAMDDPYMRERAGDVKDLGRRVLAQLQSTENALPCFGDEPVVLVAEEVTAAMLAEVPRHCLAGMVSVRGSSLSHAAILAKAMNVPAVMGLVNVPIKRFEGRQVIIDGYVGQVFVSPNDVLLNEFERLAEEERELSESLNSLRDLPSRSADGHDLPLLINAGLMSDAEQKVQAGAAGIGLYRTEVPFMLRSQFPSEDTQYEIYRAAIKNNADQPLTMRTLDVGGDKALPYFPIEEENPFLGWRGIRITLDHPELFLLQIRAMLRASAGYSNLRIALPMVSTVAEVDESLRLIRQAYNELLEDHPQLRDQLQLPPVGVVLEVPSLLFQVPAIARRVDFISIGSNDLIQYLLAVDRNNSRVAGYYSHFSPAVIKALKWAIEQAHDCKTPIYLCGEMAGDPAAAPLLLALDFDGLSMNASSLPKVKQAIRTFTKHHAQQLLARIETMETAAEVREFMWEAMEAEGLGGLVRAGR